MEKSSAEMMALLGLLAVTGYQNRDKIREMLGGAAGSGQPVSTTPQSGQVTTPPSTPTASTSGGGLGGLLGGIFGSAASPKEANAGLRDMVDVFKQSGHGDVAQSWVQKGPNQSISPSQLQNALGADTVEALAKKTGLSPEEILSRLSAVLPDAVDTMTPSGSLPEHKWTPS